MPKAERDKGLRGQLEVRHEFERAGFAIRNLGREGDNLVIVADELILHLETKRQERLNLPKWWRQAESEAPAGAMPIVTYRRSREPWRADMLLNDFLMILLRGRGL